MALEDVGVRLVIENLSGFTSGMNQVNKSVSDETRELLGLSSAFNQTRTKQEAMARSAQTNMRPALTAINSLFHVATASLLFFMASNEKMSNTMRTVTKVLTGVTLAMTAIIALYRIYAARQAIATALQWAYNTAIAAGVPIAAAFAAAVNLGIWPLTLIALAIAAVIAGIVVLIKYWDKITSIFRSTPKDIRDLNKEIKNNEDRIKNNTAQLEKLKKEQEGYQDQLKRLQDEYAYVKDNAGGYREEIGYLEGAIKSNKTQMDSLADSISKANDELNDLMSPRLTGMQESEDQIFAVEQQIKALRLEELRYGKSDALTARIDELERQKSILQLQSEIKFDPLIRSAREAGETILGMNEETAPGSVMSRISELGASITTWTGQYETIKSDTEAYEARLLSINTIVDGQLSSIEEKMLAVKNTIYDYNVALNSTSDFIATLKTNIDGLNESLKELKKPKKASWWDVPAVINSLLGAQFGGYFSKTQPVTVGERGPEVIMVPAGATVQPNTYNTNYNVNAHYTNPQSPQSIGMDLEYIRMRSRV